MINKIQNIALNTLMLLFLLVTIFPVVWMIITSLKGNNDILVGKLGFSRNSNAVNTMQAQDEDLYFSTDDGQVGVYYAANSNLQIINRTNLPSCSMLKEGQRIWLANRKGLAWFDLGKPAEMNFERPAQIPGLIADNILSTCIIKTGDRLLTGKVLIKSRDEEDERYSGQRIIEGLMVYSAIDGSYLETIREKDGLANRNITCFAKVNEDIWIGTTEGLSVYHNGVIIRSYFAYDGLADSQIRAIAYASPYVLIGTGKGITIYDERENKFTGKLDAKNGLLSNDIKTLCVYENELWAGTSIGFNRIDLETLTVQEVFERSSVDPWNISSAYVNKHDMFFCTEAGELRMLNKLTFNIMREYNIAKAGYNIHWSNYLQMWKNISFGTYFKNSIIICFATTLIAMTLATLTAYSLSRFNFPGNTFLSTSILATQMIPGLMFLIPIYLMFVAIKNTIGIQLINSYAGTIFTYAAFFVPLSIWILRSFFASIPIEIEEAARIDGCSRFGTFWRIVLPLAIPGIVATAIFIFLTAWDELMFATVLLQQKEYLTIPLGIKLYIGNHQNRFDLMMAAASVATLPIIIMFFALQKYFVRGLTAGAVKE